ncbi:alpha/beta hydrolase [Alteraurantiacibacter buctensis]|uniref:alpha/beta hydrolase n=1 Tax=Alteraurantiacibacter buctensis TaxID=1503981 RepID=UPI001F3D21F7|nr:alpha/beta hydrolase [Alteraurantiacibacter buctensis]
MQLSRRELGRAGMLALVGAALVRPANVLAQPAAPALSVAERLAPIAPELRPAARRMIENGFPAITAESLPEIQRMFPQPMPTLQPGIPVRAVDIPPAGSLPGVKVYVINSEPTLRRPAILHTHGGGHLVGSATGELAGLQNTARDLDCTIVTVEYSLSPAVRWTTSTEENYHALKWLHGNAEALGVDPARIAVMGESAGGGHAATLAIKARDRGEVPVLFQCLVYPMIDDRTGSTVTLPPHIATVGWSAAENRLGWESYLGMAPGSAGVSSTAAPARLENVAGLPPAWIGVGSVDLFAPEDIDYARRLALANVPVELLVVPGGFHGFDGAAADTALARNFTQSKLNALRRAFAQG